MAKNERQRLSPKSRKALQDIRNELERIVDRARAASNSRKRTVCGKAYDQLDAFVKDLQDLVKYAEKFHTSND